MGRSAKGIGIVSAVVAAALGMAVVPVPAQAQQEQAAGAPPALLTVSTTAGPANRSADALPDAAEGARPADVDTSLLTPGEAQTVSVDLVTDDVVVDLQPVESGSDGWAAWDGTVAGEADSSATIVRQGDDVAGLFTTDDGTFRIRTTAPGEQVVSEVTRAFPEDHGDGVVPPATFDLGVSPDDAAGADPAPSSDAPVAEGDVPTYPVIDVLVAYTPDALSYAGSTSAMNSEIALAISATNSAYTDSGIAGQLRLAGITALTENLDLSTQSLDWITYNNDGHSDQIHAIRNNSGADLVSVFTDDGTSCGLGWVLNGTTDAVSRSRYGFSTVDFPCAVDNLSFPHELGHNMGLSHDRYVDPTPTLYDYALGYVNTTGRWRTIMAYNNQCSDQGFNCTRLRRFSNPDQTYGGLPLGRPWNGSSPADERRALNITHPFVSSWRAKPNPFTSWTRFVAQQYRDFLGRNPTSSESAAAVTSLTNGSKTPQGYIDGLLNGSFGASYAPVARLYFAYFVRSPDPSGLDYWVKKYKGGMKLSAISSNFAASSEFKNKYGNLTNRAFVEKIYNNLFERNGDAGGINYWTGKLDRRESTRGQVMIGFSESSEFKRVRAEEISIVLLYRSLLQRSASSSEFSSQVARLQGGTTVQRLILEIVDSAAYSARVTK